MVKYRDVKVEFERPQGIIYLQNSKTWRRITITAAYSPKTIIQPKYLLSNYANGMENAFFNWIRGNAARYRRLIE